MKPLEIILLSSFPLLVYLGFQRRRRIEAIRAQPSSTPPPLYLASYMTPPPVQLREIYAFPRP